MKRALAPLLPLFLAACAAPVTTASNWRTVATENDRDRLRDWRKTLTGTLEAATANGEAEWIASEGPLLQPDAALGGGIPNGRYNCRWLKLGVRGGGHATYGPLPCTVGAGGGVQAFAFEAGAQRPSGGFFASDRVRLVFLGAVSLGDEAGRMRYGADPDRDMAGWVERVGPSRWRILLPRPHLDSDYDVIELVPAG